MKIYSSVFILFTILALLIFPINQNNNNSDVQDYLDIVTKSFQTTEAQINALNIEGWAQISTKGIEIKELQEIFKQITNSLGIPNNPTIDSRYEDFINIYQQEILLNEETVIYVSLQSLTSEFDPGTFLGFQLVTSDLRDDRKLYNLVTRTFSPFIDISNIGITITGTLPGKLTKEETYELIVKAFKKAGGEISEGICTEELISYSGYTSNCPLYLKVNDKKINLNIAARYHYIDNKTYLHFGAPLIFQEY